MKYLRQFRGRWWEMWAMLWAVLKEIFDESAYERFLIRNRMVASRASYAAFTRDYERIKTTRPRCC